ncbi:MAG TPA: hypothetical protein PJ982_02445, partial [Lacipirellulaceae bacterium]|nr:hypothetical protein [Lacipirellulaceae bacterium]
GRGPPAGGPSGPPAPPADLPPPGDAVVERRDGPDEVRVPKVLQELVSAVVDRTGALGLLIASVERLLQTDRVTASDPAENAWTAAGTALRLTVVRRVPDVRKLSREQAEAVLAERKFTMRAAADSQPGDIIIAQAPAAGELAPTDAPVEDRGGAGSAPGGQA